MARKTTWYCDRCHKEFLRKGITHSVMIPKQISMICYDGIRCFTDIEYDLCNDCTEDFMKFIGGRKLADDS